MDHCTTAPRATSELLPPPRWDSQCWVCLWPCELRGCCWEGRKLLASLNPCGDCRVRSAASDDEGRWQVFLLGPVLGFEAVPNVSVGLQVPSLPVLNSPVVSVPGLVVLDGAWVSSDHLAFLSKSGVHRVLAHTSLEGYIFMYLW